MRQDERDVDDVRAVMTEDAVDEAAALALDGVGDDEGDDDEAFDPAHVEGRDGPVIDPSQSSPVERDDRHQLAALPESPLPGGPGGRSLWRRVGRVVFSCIGVLVFTALVAGSAHSVSSAQPPLYAARAELRYSLDGDRSTGFLREDRRLSTQLVMLTGPDVLTPVAQEFDLGWEELERAVSAEILSDSEVIRIEARAEDPDTARDVVDAMIVEYLAQTAVNEFADREALIAAELASVQVRFDDVKVQLAAAPPERANAPSIDVRRLLAEHAELLERIGLLESQLTELALEEIDAQPAEILTDTYVLDEPVAPQVLRSTLVGGVLGMMIGILWVLLVSRLPRLRRS